MDNLEETPYSAERGRATANQGYPSPSLGQPSTTSFASWRQVVGNVLTLFTGAALARVVAALILVIIARQIGPEAYGQYSASLALVGLTSVLFSLGLDAWLLYQGGRDLEQLDVWFTSALLLKASLGALWLLGVWVLAPYLNPDSFPWRLVLLASLALWLEEIAKIVWAAFKVQLRNDLTFVMMILVQIILLGATLLLASQQIQEPEPYLGGRLLAAGIVAVVSSLLIVRALGLRLRMEAVWTALRTTLPFAVSLGLALVYSQAPLAIVAGELGGVAAGIYAPAINVTNALFLIPIAIFEVMVPILSRGNARSHAWVRRVSLRLLPIMGIVGLVLGIALALISRPLVLLLYGPAYQGSAGVLAILGGALALHCPTIALAAVLVAVGWQVRRVGVQAVAAALNVALTFSFVQRLGVTGVAKVYVASELVLLLGYLGLFILWMRNAKIITNH
jgi:O-antigen/teichoic acid export membrane protein